MCKKCVIILIILFLSIPGFTGCWKKESGQGKNRQLGSIKSEIQGEDRGISTVKKKDIQSDSDRGKRLALVIGNSNYTHGGSLANPVNDARAIKIALEKLDFTVMKHEDCDQKSMKRTIDDFGRKLKGFDVGLFFYAGHGVQAKGNNYLIPTDAELETENDVEYNCVRADRILAKMEDAGVKVNIIILDACRDNPFERSWRRGAKGKGLAFMNAPSGSLIAYATSPGNTAADGTGRNGLYTSALLQNIDIPNITILQMFQRVRSSVVEQSGKKQTPWESTSLTGDFYFIKEKEETNMAVSEKKEDLISTIEQPEAIKTEDTKDIVKIETLIPYDAPPALLEKANADIIFTTEIPIIMAPDLPFNETPDDEGNEHKAKGPEDAISTIELQGSGLVGVFGAGGSGSGMYGWRNGGGKRRAVGSGGGSAATESAVEAALQWFKRHQASDGSWSFAAFYKQCREVPPCEHLNVTRDNYNQENWNNGATGFALLCFLGAGHTQKIGRYRAQVANGLSYLEAAQSEDGSFSSNSLVHAISAMAVAEAYGMTRFQNLRHTAQKAVDVILKRQNMYLGWDYRSPSTRNDTLVTGWQIMALKSARSSGLNIRNSFEGGTQFFEKITPAIQGDPDPQLTDLCANAYDPNSNNLGTRNTMCTAIGLLSRIFMGQNTKGKVLRAHAEKMLKNLPGDYKRGELYTWYFGTLGMFQMGGNYWKKWNEAFKNILCSNQRMEGCSDGSWDPAKGMASQQGGRLLATALNCLSLEVYYGYLPVSKLK